MEADFAHLAFEVQTALPQLRVSSEVAQRQFSREVERLQSEMSGLQALATNHVLLLCGQKTSSMSLLSRE
jgi:hypothetical protein